ncbi:MAG: DUF6268 family outer membrane beta-barrel protein [Planctomycetaceae bacterium]
MRFVFRDDDHADSNDDGESLNYSSRDRKGVLTDHNLEPLPDSRGSNRDSFGESPIRRTAYQNQYPLSKDSEDLLPRDELRDLSDELSAGDEPLLSDSETESPWIVWKKTIGTATWIAPSSDGLGISSLEARGSIEFPNFPALWFVPRLAAHWLDGPTATDLPARLYDFSFETVGALPIGERWFVQAAVAPSLFTDADNTSRQSFRLPGRVLAFWKYSETLTFLGGVLYLDRDDVKALPSAGVLWNPNADWKFELAAPRPRIAWRFSHDEGSARWAYLVGEFGGGTWAIQRASGLNDVATLSDYRMMLGYERTWTTGRSWLVEAGFVFSRQLEYTSKLGDTDLPSTALVRLGATF